MFEFIESISVDAAAGSAHGRAFVPADQPLLADHFPGKPLLPGSWLIELAAQIAGPLAEELAKQKLNLDRWALVGMIRDAKFLEPVSLPATIILLARADRVEASSVTVDVSAEVDDQRVMRAQLVMMMAEAAPEWDEAIQAREGRLARWKAMV